jgi:type IV pilus assembly protein PilA
MKTARREEGFTLVELLIVIGILGVLLAIVLVALNPARQFSQANNTKRRNDVNAILNAVHQFGADNNGTIPANIPTAAPAGVIGDGVGQADICDDIVPLYLAQLPGDPTTGTGTPADCSVAYSTGYTIISSATNNRVTVAAPDAELSELISVTR